MTYRFVGGSELRTRYSGAPQVSITGQTDGPVGLTLRFPSSPAAKEERAAYTILAFDNVFEYRWVMFDSSYFLLNREDFEFALIEIVESELIAAMLDGGMYANSPAGQRLGGTIHEDLLRHYRIGFDDYGTIDVVCLDLRIKIEPGSV